HEGALQALIFSLDGLDGHNPTLFKFGCAVFVLGKWCARRDSNPHILRYWNLNPARLPVPPRARGPRRGAYSKDRAAGNPREKRSLGAQGVLRMQHPQPPMPPPTRPPETPTPGQPGTPSPPPPETPPVGPDIDVPTPQPGPGPVPP